MLILKRLLLAILLIAVLSALMLGGFAYFTEREIQQQRQRILSLAQTQSSLQVDVHQIAQLPPPVQRFIQFTFPHGIRTDIVAVEVDMEGLFRRPQTTSFSPTTAQQTFVVRLPALIFDAHTQIPPLLWARAYDVYAQGDMQMRAKIMSAITVVDEQSSAELNRISLRRWLLESSYYPMALLPGGVVQWQAIDENRARAVVHSDGLSASLIATFAADGRLLQWDAEQDGDLNTPYHGSGEHAARADYQLIDNMMIPKKFMIARSAQGKIEPFWQGHITRVKFIRATQ